MIRYLLIFPLVMYNLIFEKNIVATILNDPNVRKKFLKGNFVEELFYLYAINLAVVDVFH